uniref:RPGRIP1 like n=1 Tax=Hucho hucho TaxID=62062 RepID=A0A4W5KYM7_9TELE
MSTFADETAADVPVKDITLNLTKVGTLVAQNARARQAILRVSREELEDRFLRLHEENLLLKQHTHKQEDKIKRMATKLVRLVKDRRRVEQVAAGGVRPGGRDVELEEMMEELQEKVQELQMQNEGLKQRLLAAKQQLQTQSKRPTPYGHVQSRVNTGLRRLREDTFTLVEMSGRAPQGLLPRYGHSLLDDARAEIRNLENVIETQRSHIEEMDRAAELLRDQLRRKERKFEESLLHLREQQTTGQRSTIKDNVEMIRLQKQLVEKGNAFTVLEGRFLQLQESQRTLKASHEAVMAKVDELMGQLKDERLRSLGLESQLQANSFSQRRTEELQEQIYDLEKERVLLKENCDKLVNSAFDVSQDQKFRTREQQLKLQIAQLELALKSDLTDKNEILDKIKVERDMNEKLSQEKEDIQLRFLEQKQQLEEIRDRVKFYTKESEIDVAELSEALMLIKVRKSQRSGELGFLEQVEEEVRSDTEHSMRELQATHAETIQELEKTRNMLIVQHKINKDYQAEVEAVTRKMDDSKLQYELKLESLAQLLDMRAAKIKKLEAQLKDIAYGTKSHVFKPEVTDDDVADEFDETVHLERGENLLEIHIGMATLSPVALETLSDREPSTFCTYAFYDFELQATPVVRGARPAYGFTSQYVVRVDDLFLQYLHTGSVTLELQLARGMDFTTVAVGQLRLTQLLENASKAHGTVQLVGVAGEVQSFGSVEYWVRLRVPMEQAIRLYKERVKALGYLSSAFNAEQQVASGHCNQTNLSWTDYSVSADGGMNLNELNVTVRCCSNLTSRHAHPPSPYVVYQFYDFPDHDTCIVGDCSEPQFEDHVSFPVAMEAELDSYLKAGALLLYVFDDHDTQSEMYLGKARVPLLSLAHDKAITGTFELTDPSGLPNGHIDVTLKWKFTYLPPPGSTMTVEQAKFVPKERPVKLTTRKVEEKKVEVEEKREEEEKREGKKEELVVKEEQRAKALLPLPTTSTASEVITVAEDEEQSESILSDSDDCIVPGQSSMGRKVGEPGIEDRTQPVCLVLSESIEDRSTVQLDRKILYQASCLSLQPSESVRVEIVSLSLKPESRAAADSSVVRLFVEYSLLDMPSEETPLSLSKPSPGKTSHYNYSNGKGYQRAPTHTNTLTNAEHTHTPQEVGGTLIGEDGFVAGLAGYDVFDAVLDIYYQSLIGETRHGLLETICLMPFH